MARPQPTILTTKIMPDGTAWDILKADAYYIITYRGEPCGIRQHYNTLTAQGFRYQKLTYTGLGSALAQVKRLNEKFNCLDFDVMEVV